MLVAFSQPSNCVYFSFGLLEMSASSMRSKNIQAQGLLSSFLGIGEETKLVQKQGIVTILSSDCERNRASSSSLRRTLSADMSSKKWLSQNGFSPVKKIASSEKLSHSETIIAAAAASESDSSSSSERESDDCEERKDLDAKSIWSSIQKDKKNKESEKPGVFDIWSSIISPKTNEDASKLPLPPPYVHPLVKRSQSSLSEKSLEICTESLGSETGSDGFSSYPSSEAGDAEDYKEEEEQQPEKETQQACYETDEDFATPKCNYSATTKKTVPRSFPPPLPSLTRQDGPSIHMKSHRDNGRLVLEAVSVPSQNNFYARRQDGRLLLTFNNHLNKEESHDDEEKEGDYDEEELKEEFGGFEEDHEEVEDEDRDEKTEEIGESEIEKEPIVSSGIIKSVDGLALTMNKPIGFVNRNPKWSEKLNEVVNFEEKTSSVAKSLPPRPRVARLVPSAPAVAAASASLNAYEYYWKTKSTNHRQHNSSPRKKNNSSSNFAVSGEFNQTPKEKLLVLGGKNGDYMVHNLKSCKESRRSFLFWEPHCIATS